MIGTESIVYLDNNPSKITINRQKHTCKVNKKSYLHVKLEIDVDVELIKNNNKL